ncbi:MAG: cellobiose phosphorylase, partial [Alphaproteobacteria bacterium]
DRTVTAAAGQPHADPIEAAARALQSCHCLTGRPPRVLAAWADLHAMPTWLRHLRIVCAAAEPESGKAAEWLLDNHYQLRRAVAQIREDLPPAFYRRLPAVADGAGLPRVFCLAHAMLQATHLQLSLATTVAFVNAYQEGAPLSIAELWALPTMLRLACLEIAISGATRAFPGLAMPFALSPLAAALDALDPTECIARALACLHAAAAMPWKDFFERTSRVEALLRDDPAAVYARMDFDTRDRYRKAIEDLAEGAQRTEPAIAEHVLAMARNSAADVRRGHVGYWLVGRGRRQLEAALNYRPPFGAACRRWLLRHAGAFYASGLALTTLAALAVPAAYLWLMGAPPLPWVLGVLLCLIPATILAVTLVNWLVTLIVPPRVLPKLDFEKAVPADCRTAVVMPVIIADAREVPALVERLEMHWIANRDPNLRFALLSDLADAPHARMPQDDAIEDALVAGIRRLNRRHGAGGERPFHLLHRQRLYNAREGCWMGWERKRGKLEQFNRFVLGEAVDAFTLCEGDSENLRGVRFVLTVDADTVLPMGTAHRLIGTLAHPLNRAQTDPEDGRLRAGYTVIQPRVEISPESGARSLFTRLYAGDTAIDIYSRAVSDVYQDLFGVGIYVGKGIYDVAAFQHCLDGRVPENSLLSHDLFEGAHGGVALASDIVLYDAFPASYGEYMRRWHRWVRGDWQLLAWLRGRVPAAAGRHLPNGLPALERWKILDNLRRSLIPFNLVALSLAGWLALPGSPWVWTVLTVAAPGAYLFTDLVSGLARGRR